jgi:taurine--2-oxoglutarate transaminase
VNTDYGSDHDRSAEWVASAHQEYNVTSWSAQGGAAPMVVRGGEGSWFWDDNGKRYLDFQSQLVNLNLGHQHPDLVQAIKDQADRLCYIGPGMANDMRSELAEAIAQVTPGDLHSTFFTSGGAAAVENAIRLARHVTGRQKVVSRYRSYHGATAGALAVTGEPRRWLNEPGPTGVVRMLDPYCYRCPMGHTAACGVCTATPHVEELLMYENPNTVAAIIVEPITGTNGIIVPPDGYLQGLRDLCDKYGIMLIFDEVMSGFGRTGKWFACDHWGVTPDILCVAKGLNSGYVPLGAMVVRQHLSDWMKSNVFPGGLTYSGHPLACASGVASIRVYQRDGIVENAAARGEQLATRLQTMMDKYQVIGEVRGRGLFWGVELVNDRATREPFVPFNAKGPANQPMSRLMTEAMSRGLYLSAFSNIIRIAPPLVITADEIDLGCDMFDEVMGIADSMIAAG